MSDSPYVRDERYARIPEYDPFDGPGPAYAPGAGGASYAPFDPHTADTLGYGETYPGGPGPAASPAPSRPLGPYGTHPDTYVRGPDTYAPAHASHRESGRPAGPYGTQASHGGHAPRDTALPRQSVSPADAGRPAPGGPAPTGSAPTGPAPTGPAPAGGSAGRAHTPRRADGSVRRLLPQALVVAFLAGGTSAFVAEDKAVELTLDGRSRTLHTFADDVSELLAQEGVHIGAHDVVTPAPGTGLEDGGAVEVRHGRPLRLTLDGRRHELWTTARTVDEALGQLGVRAEGAYLSAARSLGIPRAGLTLDVRTERSVTVMADGRARTIRTNAATVGEAVEQAGVTLHGQDTTSVPPGSFPRDGQTVTVLRITRSKEVREEPIPFEVERTEDPTLFRGTVSVEQPGQPGLRRVTYHLRTVNGVRQRPRTVDTEIVRRPRPRIVKVGTRPMPTAVRGADRLDWAALAACESGGRPSAVDPSGTYGGLYQFDVRTWQGLGGSGRPQDAPAAEQTFRAKKLYVRRGASPWPHCGARLHG